MGGAGVDADPAGPPDGPRRCDGPGSGGHDDEGADLVRPWSTATDRSGCSWSGCRAKLVATGRGFETRVGDLMSAPLISVPAEVSAGQVLTLMYERGMLHHVPVMGDGDRLIGIVTDTDLMGLEQWKPFALKSELERAPDAEAAIDVARRLPQVFVARRGGRGAPRRRARSRRHARHARRVSSSWASPSSVSPEPLGVAGVGGQARRTRARDGSGQRVRRGVRRGVVRRGSTGTSRS